MSSSRGGGTSQAGCGIGAAGQLRCTGHEWGGSDHGRSCGHVEVDVGGHGCCDSLASSAGALGGSSTAPGKGDSMKLNNDD